MSANKYKFLKSAALTVIQGTKRLVTGTGIEAELSVIETWRIQILQEALLASSSNDSTVRETE